MFIPKRQSSSQNSAQDGFFRRLFPNLPKEMMPNEQPQDISVSILNRDSNQRQSNNQEKQENNAPNQQWMEVEQIEKDQYKKESTNKKTKKIKKDNPHQPQKKPNKQDDEDKTSNSDNSGGSRGSESSNSSEERSSQNRQNSSNFQSQQNSQKPPHPVHYHFYRSNPISQPSNGRSSLARGAYQSQSQRKINPQPPGMQQNSSSRQSAEQKNQNIAFSHQLIQQRQKLNQKLQSIHKFMQQISQFQQEFNPKDDKLTEQKKEIAKILCQSYIALTKFNFSEYAFSLFEPNWLNFQSADKFLQTALKQVQTILLNILPLKPIYPLSIEQPCYPIINQGAKYLDALEFFDIVQDSGEQNKKSKRKFLLGIFSRKKDEAINSQKQLNFKLKKQFQDILAFKYYLANDDAQFSKELNTTNFQIFISNWVKFDKVLQTLKEKIKIQMDFKKSKPADLAFNGYQILSIELEKLNHELKMFSLSLSDDAEMWFHASAMGYLVNCLIDQRSYKHQLQKQAQEKLFARQKKIFEKFIASNKDESA